MHRSDVVVLGGGVAGAAAALAARSAGAVTTLVRRGPGATALAAGAWTGQPPPELRTLLGAAGLDLLRVDGLLPHPDGRLMGAELAPASHAAAALAGGAEGGLVCGVMGLAGFRAAAVARLWTAAARLPEHALGHVTITLAETPAGGWSPVSLAALLEREPQRLAAPLARAVRDHGSARVFMPPVLGLEGHARVWDEVRRTVGVRVGESLGTQPSIPGWRLDRSLLRALSTAGVELVTGTASRIGAVGRRLEWVGVGTAAGEVRVQGGGFVLATGKFIGGGITAAPVLHETATGLRVLAEVAGTSFGDAADSVALTAAAREGPHALLEAGVPTTGMRPLDADGRVAWENMWAAGSVRAGVSASRGGLGDHAAEGWAAGLRAAGAAPDGEA